MAVPADAEGLVQDAEIKENNVKVTIEPTPIQSIQWDGCENQIDIKRDDMIPFSFGGNKVRIGYEYWKEAREWRLRYHDRLWQQPFQYVPGHCFFL